MTMPMPLQLMALLVLPSLLFLLPFLLPMMFFFLLPALILPLPSLSLALQVLLLFDATAAAPQYMTLR